LLVLMIKTFPSSFYGQLRQAHDSRRSFTRHVFALRSPFVFHSSHRFIVRCFSSEGSIPTITKVELGTIPTITKAELEELIESETGYVLLDVREDHEVRRTGLIPTAHHVPLDSLFMCLNEPRKWRPTFGFRRPKKIDNLIFYCRMGGRSHAAAVAAQSKGYENVKNYVGSAREWFYSGK